MAERLRRSARERMFFGVCGGIADYFRMDPTIVRLIFVVTGLVGGIGVFVYLVLAILMPEAIAAGASTSAGTTGESAATTGATAAPEESAPSPIDRAAERMREALGTDPERGRQVGAIILIALGAFFLLSNAGFFDFVRWQYLWPLLLIAIGVVLLAQRARR
jgi:phage shock protein C